jgi:hypothetical protein
MDFHASLSAQIQSCIITLNDESNYDTSTQNGHLQSDFSALTMFKIMRPVDGHVCVIGTQYVSGADTIIPAPSDEIQTSLQVPQEFVTVNGDYIVTLVTIPTWNQSQNYEPGDVVYHEPTGQVWFADTSIPSGTVPVEGSDWMLIDIDDIADDENSPYNATIEVSLSCLVQNTILYQTSLVTVGNSVDVTMNPSGSQITAVDHSNIFTNNENGHGNFPYWNRVVFTTPGGSIFELSSFTGAQNPVPAPVSANQEFGYLVQDGDTDGVWTVELWHVPTWQTGVLYNVSTATVVVWHNGKLWRRVADSMSVEPGTNASVWIEYTGDLKETRYYDIGRFVTTRLTARPAYEKLAAKLSGKIHRDPCDVDWCGDKCLKSLMTMRILLDIIDIDSCKGRYDNVKQHFIAFNKLVCNGCC